MELEVGDRVRIVPHDSWRQPIRGWAERGRLATVQNVFVPNGGAKEQASVRFDRERIKGPGGNYFFAVSDLLLVERPNLATPTHAR